MKKTISLVVFGLVSSIAVAQTNVTAKVKTLNNEGSVGFALYQKDNFMQAPTKAKTIKVEDKTAVVTFEGLPKGEYAILCYHDKNNNGQMDFATNGMPLEDYGATNNRLNAFGPPTFEDAKFAVDKTNLTFEIKF